MKCRLWSGEPQGDALRLAQCTHASHLKKWVGIGPFTVHLLWALTFRAWSTTLIQFWPLKSRGISYKIACHVYMGEVFLSWFWKIASPLCHRFLAALKRLTCSPPLFVHNFLFFFLFLIRVCFSKPKTSPWKQNAKIKVLSFYIAKLEKVKSLNFHKNMAKIVI